MSMSHADKVQCFDRLLKQLCLIDIKDTGLDEGGLHRWLDGCADAAAVRQSVLNYAEKYGLDVIAENTP